MPDQDAANTPESPAPSLSDADLLPEQREIQPLHPECIALHQVLDDAPLGPAHWKIWFLCAMGIFLDGFDLFVIAVALPLIAQDLGPSKWMLGMIGAAAPLGAMVGAAVLGPVTDKIGRKTMYMIDLGIFAVFSVFCL